MKEAGKLLISSLALIVQLPAAHVTADAFRALTGHPMRALPAHLVPCTPSVVLLTPHNGSMLPSEVDIDAEYRRHKKRTVLQKATGPLFLPYDGSHGCMPGKAHLLALMRFNDETVQSTPCLWTSATEAAHFCKQWRACLSFQCWVPIALTEALRSRIPPAGEGPCLPVNAGHEWTDHADFSVYTPNNDGDVRINQQATVRLVPKLRLCPKLTHPRMAAALGDTSLRLRAECLGAACDEPEDVLEIHARELNASWSQTHMYTGDVYPVGEVSCRRDPNCVFFQYLGACRRRMPRDPHRERPFTRDLSDATLPLDPALGVRRRHAPRLC